jgi:hypothetical protein
VISDDSTYAVVTRARPPEYARYVVTNPWFLTALALLLSLGLVTNALPSAVLATMTAVAVATAAPLLPPLRRRIRRQVELADRARLVNQLEASRRADVLQLERLVAQVATVMPERRGRLDRLLDAYVRAAVVEGQLRLLIDATRGAVGDSLVSRRRRGEHAGLQERADEVAARMVELAELVRLGHQHWIAASLTNEAARLAELIADDERELWETIDCSPELACDFAQLRAHDAS